MEEEANTSCLLAGFSTDQTKLSSDTQTVSLKKSVLRLSSEGAWRQRRNSGQVVLTRHDIWFIVKPSALNSAASTLQIKSDDENVTQKKPGVRSLPHSEPE